MTVIRFTFEQVTCGFPVLSPPSHSRTVATNSLPDGIKYFVQLLWDVFMKFLWVHAKWTYHSGYIGSCRWGLSTWSKCNRCNLQYIGETKRRLKDRFNEHRRTIDNPNNKSKPTTAAEHFLSSPNHTANDMLLIPIEKIFSNRDSIRKAREAFLIKKGKTIDPDGLNIREETY